MFDYYIDYDEWIHRDKPFGLSGCFRLRNEAEFMERAVESFLPWLDEAVLVVQPSEDDTVAIAYDLADRYPHQVRVCEYLYIPDWIDTPGFYKGDPNEPGHLVHMSNWALSQCRYSWIAKVEGDVIALPTFGRIREAIEAQPVIPMYYGFYIVNMAGLNCNQFSVTVPRNGGWDECVINNNPGRWKFHRIAKWETIPRNGPSRNMGWCGLHMKRCKARNIGWNNEVYMDYTPENLRRVLTDFNQAFPYEGTDDPLGIPELFEVAL